jgi:hypothetical protein
MPTKPRTAAGYEPGQVAHVRATCLYVATKLGDLVDELVIVGGPVPSLIVDQATAPMRHVGTADLDIGLALAVFDAKRYQVLTERLRQAVVRSRTERTRQSHAPALGRRRAPAGLRRLPCRANGCRRSRRANQEHRAGLRGDHRARTSPCTSRRRFVELCRSNKIPGAHQEGKVWVCPREAWHATRSRRREGVVASKPPRAPEHSVDALLARQGLRLIDK